MLEAKSMLKQMGWLLLMDQNQSRLIQVLMNLL
jgi:hypothetical protein